MPDTDMRGVSVELSKKYNASAWLIELIRHFPDRDKSFYSSQLHVSWPTVNNYISELVNNKIIHEQDNRFCVNSQNGILVGLAVGCNEIKLTFIDLSFNCISLEEIVSIYSSTVKNTSTSIDELLSIQHKQGNCICLKSPDTIFEMSERINDLMSAVVELVTLHCVPIRGIGFAFTGAVDPTTSTIVDALNKLCLKGTRIENLVYLDKLNFFHNHGIPLVIEHNAKTTAIAEKELLYYFDKSLAQKQNIAVVYMGTGISVGLILDNILYRGSNNFSGEIGHITAPAFDELETTLKKAQPVCSCGKDNCLEYRFRSYGLQEAINKKNFNELNETQIKAIKFYIQFIIEQLSNLLNLDLIIFSGKLSKIESDIWNAINALKRNSALYYTVENTDIIKSPIIEPSAAVGAAINAYYSFVNMGASEKELNKSGRIEWFNTSVDE